MFDFKWLHLFPVKCYLLSRHQLTGKVRQMDEVERVWREHQQKKREAHVLRSCQLLKKTKGDLCAMYRRMGGMGGIHPPEKWRKDEIVSSIVEIEERRAQAEREARGEKEPPRPMVRVVVLVETADTEPGRMLAYLTESQPGPLAHIADKLAVREEKAARDYHRYYGKLHVTVWTNRGEAERITNPPPAEAFRYGFMAVKEPENATR